VSFPPTLYGSQWVVGWLPSPSNHSLTEPISLELTNGTRLPRQPREWLQDPRVPPNPRTGGVLLACTAHHSLQWDGAWQGNVTQRYGKHGSAACAPSSPSIRPGQTRRQRAGDANYPTSLLFFLRLYLSDTSLFFHSFSRIVTCPPLGL
jgi:hypothetical protein